MLQQHWAAWCMRNERARVGQDRGLATKPILLSVALAVVNSIEVDMKQSVSWCKETSPRDVCDDTRKRVCTREYKDRGSGKSVRMSPNSTRQSNAILRFSKSKAMALTLHSVRRADGDVLRELYRRSGICRLPQSSRR